MTILDNKACSFFGHRDIEITNELKEKLKTLLIDLIENKSVGYFYFGGFGDFDDLCWKVATELKFKYPHIQRIYVCEDYKLIDRPHKRPKWLKDEDYDDFIYFDMRYTGFYQRIYFRNCEIIDNSDYIVFYVTNTENSGAYKAMQYAKKNKKMIINISKI